jgi:hypothetical protein
MLGLPPTPWLSYLFASSPALAHPPLLLPRAHRAPSEAVLDGLLPASSYAARSLVLNRWGGLGMHRFPVGFSGDAETTWEVLKLQVYITSTAANVAFQWSHDIGGSGFRVRSRSSIHCATRTASPPLAASVTFSS